MYITVNEEQVKLGAIQLLNKEEGEPSVLAFSMEGDKAVHFVLTDGEDGKDIKDCLQIIIAFILENNETSNIAEVTPSAILQLLKDSGFSCTYTLVHGNKTEVANDIPLYVLIEDSAGVFSIQSMYAYDNYVTLAGINKKVVFTVTVDDTLQNQQYPFQEKGFQLILTLLALKRGSKPRTLRLKDLKAVAKQWGLNLNFLQGVELS